MAEKNKCDLQQSEYINCDWLVGWWVGEFSWYDMV